MVLTTFSPRLHVSPCPRAFEDASAPKRRWHPNLVGLLLLTLAACSDAPANKAKPAAKTPEVDVITAAAVDIKLGEVLHGRLQASRSAQVRARSEGIVQRQWFKEGSQVKAGQSLYQLERSAQQAALAAATAEHQAAKENLRRINELLPLQGASQQEQDNALTRIKVAESSLANARLQLENTQVLAPISGYIGRSLVTEGTLVGKAEATLMAHIDQTDKLWVLFGLNSNDWERYQKAAQAKKIKLLARPELELLDDDGKALQLPLRLLARESSADTGTGSIGMKAEFNNPKAQLLPGTLVSVRWTGAVLPQGFLLPQRAVSLPPQGQPQVWLVKADGTLEKRSIELWGMEQGQWLVSGGLSAGEQVVVQGLQRPKAGMAVKANPWKNEPPAANKRS